MSSRCTALGRVESELVSLPEKALARDATRRLRIVIHAAGWLHTMMLHGRFRCCLLTLADSSDLADSYLSAPRLSKSMNYSSD